MATQHDDKDTENVKETMRNSPTKKDETKEKSPKKVTFSEDLENQETDDELNDQWFNEMKEISLRKEALLQHQLEVAAENQRLMQEMIAEQRHLRAAQEATQASHEKLRKEQAEATKKLNKISSTLEAILLDSRQQQADKENDPGLNKALYGLKVSPKRWNERFSEVATELGLENDINEPCLYTWALTNNTLSSSVVKPILSSCCRRSSSTFSFCARARHALYAITCLSRVVCIRLVLFLERLASRLCVYVVTSEDRMRERRKRAKELDEHATAHRKSAPGRSKYNGAAAAAAAAGKQKKKKSFFFKSRKSKSIKKVLILWRLQSSVYDILCISIMMSKRAYGLQAGVTRIIRSGSTCAYRTGIMHESRQTEIRIHLARACAYEKGKQRINEEEEEEEEEERYLSRASMYISQPADRSLPRPSSFERDDPRAAIYGKRDPRWPSRRARQLKPFCSTSSLERE
ncbi:unnamed protein product, partial [Trichogramma brassicae]